MAVRSSSPISFLTILSGLYAALLLIYVALRITLQDSWPVLALLHNLTPFFFTPLLVLLPLSLILRQQQASVINVLMAFLAAVMLIPHITPARLPNKTLSYPHKLRIISYNMHDNPYGVWSWLKDQPPADIVLFQEVPAGFANIITPLLGRVYPYLKAQPPEWGNMVMSRFPIENYSDVPLSHPDSLTSSVAQRFTVRVDVPRIPQQVTMYNVHLSWPLNENVPPAVSGVPDMLSAVTNYDERGRNAELTELLMHVSRDDGLVVVAGDFNISEFSFAYNRLAEMLRDAYRDVRYGFGFTWPVWQEGNVKLPALLRLDYVWHTSNMHTIEAQRGPRLPSDHYPLLITLALP